MDRSIKKKRKVINRFSLLFYFLFVCLVLVFWKLIQVQAVDAGKYEEMAVSQRMKKYELAPDRGSIYDRNGEILALSTDMDTVFATPYQVKEKRKAAGKIATILGEDTSTILHKLNSDSGFEYLARKIDRDKADKLKDLKIDGLGFVKESKRQYPGGELAAHVIGFVGLDNIGLSGLELYYDRQLKGEPGRVIAEQGINGFPIPGGTSKFESATNGSQLVLTIDKAIQYKAELELRTAIERYDAAGGNIVVMNPKNGEIYALASFPNFDLNVFNKAEDEALSNSAIADVYEPGSTMKIVTSSAALEEKVFTPDSKFTLPGSLNIGGWTIKEAHGRSTEEFTLKSIVTRSSNIGAVVIGRELGKDRILEYIEKFGLNSMVGIDLPGESVGYVPPADSWSASTIATVPFGQGTSVTPIEMARFFATLANKGIQVKPHLVDRLITPEGKEIRPFTGEKEKTVVSAKTCEMMSAIMEEAVTEGTGKSAAVTGYSVAGKTGTAQKPNVGKPGYSGKYVGSFIGYTPVQDPAVVILVTIDEPRKAIYGGVIAAPVFSKVAEFALQRLNVPPDKTEGGP